MIRRQVRGVLTGLLLGLFVAMLASTVISTSLPTIIHDLSGDQTAYTWVVTAALLTMAVSTPVWGKLSDIASPKLLFLVAITIFTLATMSSGIAQNTAMLIASRTVQGIGVGGLVALSQIIMADIAGPRERGRYMGLFGAVMATANVGGPLLGGFITDAWGWRWNFYVSVPFTIAAAVIVQRTLRAPSRSGRRLTLDYLGLALLSAAVSLLLIWVSLAGDQFEWWSLTTALMTGGAAVATALFVVVELRSRTPLIPLSLFRNATFTLSVLASIATGIAMFGAAVYLGQYMQLARGATPTEAGLMTTPMIGGMLLSSVVGGAIISRSGVWKAYTLSGAASLAAGSILLSTVHADTDFLLVSVYMVLLGCGMGMTMQNLVLVVQNAVSGSVLGVASSGVIFFRSLGGSIGISLMGAALAARITGLVAERREEITAVIEGLGSEARVWTQRLQSGSLPEVSAMPPALRAMFEEFYADGIARAFSIMVPFALISLVAVAFLPNRRIARMTPKERLHAAEADLAVAAVPEAMDGLRATGDTPLRDDDASGAASRDARAEPCAQRRRSLLVRLFRRGRS